MVEEKELEQLNTEDSVEERVVNKLKKTIILSKNLSTKQQNHINSLAAKKKGTKYVKQVPETEVELPTEIKTTARKPRAPRVKVVEPEISEETEVVVIKKKPKKRVEVIEESESESEEEIKPKKKTKAKAVVKQPVKKTIKAPVKKAPVKKVPEPIEEQNQFKSLFNKRLF